MRLTEQQRRITAAILGVSNAGQDHLFRGRGAPHREECVEYLMKKDRSLDDMVYYFVASICEDETMLDMFQDEARSWYKNLRKESLDNLAKVHTDYAHLFRAMNAPKDGPAFNKLVNKVSRMIDADSDIVEVKSIVSGLGYNTETGNKVAKELGR